MAMPWGWPMTDDEFRNKSFAARMLIAVASGMAERGSSDEEIWRELPIFIRGCTDPHLRRAMRKELAVMPSTDFR